MIGSGTSLPQVPTEVEHVQVVALYDPRDGTIRHLHTVTTLAGATPLTEHEATAEAKAHAERRHGSLDQLEVALSNDVEHARSAQCIDPSTRHFVPWKPASE